MGYFEQLVKLAAAAQRRSVAVWTAYADSQILDATQTVAVLAAQIQQSNAAASNLASVAFAAKQSAALQRLTPVPVISRPDDAERLHKAARTVLQTAHDSPVPQDIVARLARSESLQAAADAFSAEMQQSLYAEGYVRKINPDACERCVRWAKGGKVFKPDTRFPMHPGCTCTPDPVFTTRNPELPSYELPRAHKTKGTQ